MSLTSYRAAPPRDQGFSRYKLASAKQVLNELKRIDPVLNPIAGQFQEFEAHPAGGVGSLPVRPGKAEIRGPRIKPDVRSIMLKGFQGAARMVPGGHQDRAVNMFLAQEFDGVQGVFPRGRRFVLDLDRFGRHAVFPQNAPVNDVVAFTREDDRRGIVPAIKIRRAGGALESPAAENDQDIGRHFAAVHTEEILGVKISVSGN